MSAKTKIVVLRMKEIIYTAIFIGLVLFLVMLFFFMFRPQKDAATPTSNAAKASYTPGLYSASLQLGNQDVTVEVTVDAWQITSVSLAQSSESVAAMYPLMQPSMETLAAQIVEKQSFDGLEYPSGAQYTSMALVKAIKTALSKAEL